MAQHSVDTAKLLDEHDYDPEIQFYGLHHDSAEAYLGDVQKPNKEVLPSIEELEDTWQEAVWDFLDVDAPDLSQKSTVKDVDYMLYLFEAEKLFENSEHSRAATERVELTEVEETEEIPSVAEVANLDQTYQESKNEFLELHEELITRI